MPSLPDLNRDFQSRRQAWKQHIRDCPECFGLVQRRGSDFVPENERHLLCPAGRKLYTLQSESWLRYHTAQCQQDPS